MKKRIIVLVIMAASTAAIALYYHYQTCQSGCCSPGEKAAKVPATTDAACGKCGETSCSRSCGGEPGKTMPSCNLDATTQLKRFDEVIKPTFIQASAILELPDGWDIVFQQSPELVMKLNEIATFERKCCDTFNWEVTEEPGQKLAHLKVSGSQAIKTEMKSGFEQLGLAHLIGK